MSALVLLIVISLAVAGSFLGAFLWAVRSGQFDDSVTPSMRMLTDDVEPTLSTNPTNDDGETEP